VLLRGPAHHEQAPVAEIERAPGFALAVTHEEAARRAERERRDRDVVALGSELALVVGVPADRVVAVAVVVREHGVPRDAGPLAQECADPREPGRPECRLVGLARVAIAAARIAVPRDQARHRDAAPEHRERVRAQRQLGRKRLGARPLRASEELGPPLGLL